MSTQRLVLTGLLIVALLAPGAAASTLQPAASPARPTPASTPAAPGDEYWAAGFNLHGMNGTVYALAVGLDGSLYAGGDFNTAGGAAANGIARWDAATSSWHPLGSVPDLGKFCIGPAGFVHALAGDLREQIRLSGPDAEEMFILHRHASRNQTLGLVGRELLIALSIPAQLRQVHRGVRMESLMGYSLRPNPTPTKAEVGEMLLEDSTLSG